MEVTKQQWVQAYLDWQWAEQKPPETWDFQECLRLRARYRQIQKAYWEQGDINET